MDTNPRKAMLEQAFDTVAEAYDHPALSFFPKTAACIMEQLALPDHVRLLDVCTGTGMLSLRAAEHLSCGEVTGIDLSAGMLAQARLKAAEQGLDNTTFIQMDLDHLNLPTLHFDVATCSFGLFFLDDMAHGLSNIAAVVRPGGTIAISSFTDNAFEPFSQCFLDRYQSYGFEVPPLSWRRLASEQQIRDIFSTAGLDDIRFHHQPMSYTMSSAQDWWDVVWNAGYRALLNQLSEAQQQEFRREHLAEIAALHASGSCRLETNVIIAIAHKPDA